MASTNWLKLKSAAEVKALLRHDEREKREAAKEHRNYHIDKSKTHLNYSMIGRTYTERCNIYDNALQSALSVAANNVETYVPKKGKNAGKTMQRKKGKLRKDAVTALDMYTTVPADLPECEYDRWLRAVHDIEVEFFGAENVIDSDVHYDEVHEYFDTWLKKWTLSRVHMHTTVIPRTKDGRLCCNEIFTRDNCTKLNDLIEAMTRKEFGVAFNTGETPRKESVEALKCKSFRAEKEIFDDLQRGIAELSAKKSEYEEQLEGLRAEVADLMAVKAETEQSIAGSLEKFKELNEAIQSTRTAAEMTMQEAMRDMDELDKQISNKQEQADDLDAQISDSRTILEDMSYDISAYQNQLKDLEDKKASNRGEISKQQNKLDELNSLIKSQTIKLNNLTDSVRAAERVKEAGEQADSVNSSPKASRYDSALGLFNGY